MHDESEEKKEKEQHVVEMDGILRKNGKGGDGNRDRTHACFSGWMDGLCLASFCLCSAVGEDRTHFKYPRTRLPEKGPSLLSCMCLLRLAFSSTLLQSFCFSDAAASLASQEYEEEENIKKGGGKWGLPNWKGKKTYLLS